MESRSGQRAAPAWGVGLAFRKIRVSRRWALAKLAALALAVCLCAGGVLQSQSGGQQPQQNSNATPGMPNPGRRPSQGGLFDDSFPQPRSAREIAALNRERQREMASDTQKLLRLATELKSDVEKAGLGASMSGEAQKAAQIEKLARSVREKMSATFAN